MNTAIHRPMTRSKGPDPPILHRFQGGGWLVAPDGMMGRAAIGEMGNIRAEDRLRVWR